MMTPTTRARMRRRYDRWSPVIALLAFVIGAAGAASGGTAMLANERQDEQRDIDQSALLACFDTYASATSEATRAVRGATVRKELAEAARDRALNREGIAFLRLVRKITTGQASGPGAIVPLRDALEDRARAADRLERAQAVLDEVRANNPIPQPPSVVCEQQTEDAS